ncbi:hypothetical protein E1176_12960 [Fulvivirga sp. RKSG066]|uniref:hypothetical protein n=1 Tax=Fulvivirga aurantia TaxID=2529383 RepID=UPI0012BC9E94|nr:hypothetical protein [Fulvivirga aurantia]MTI21935.1 hypothetical protein [Fulvivirga aurantia]
MKNLTYILVVALLAMGCSQSTIPSASDESYKEDLEPLRPKILAIDDSMSFTIDSAVIKKDYSSIEPTYDVTANLNAVLDSIVSLRSNVNYVDGFTILVYSGTDSEKARLAKGKVFTILHESRPILKFDEPNFRVKVGKYYSRLEAQRDYAAIKKEFTKAIIIPEKIYIN